MLAVCGGEPVGPDTNPTASVCEPVGSGVAQGGQGSIGDTVVPHDRRLVLMGGAAEDDDASRSFLVAAGGGDVLILRASGSTTSYPSYFMQTLAPDPRPSSAVTLRLDVPGAGGNPGVLCRVQHAEAVWLAGGDQWSYLGLWPTALHVELDATADRDIAIGGTSAGAMALGGGAFDAREGSVTSAEALADPTRTEVSVTRSPFGQPELTSVIVDTHFSERDREGRLLAFLARFAQVTGGDEHRGIGLDEGTAIIIADGTFAVFGPAGSGAVWLYEYTGTPELQTGIALSMDSLRRIRLEGGDSGTWPIDFDAWFPVTISVDDGVVSTGPPADARRSEAR